MSHTMLRTGDIWLWEALEIMVESWWPLAWEASEPTVEEADERGRYQYEKSRWDEYQIAQKAVASQSLSSLGKLAVLVGPPPPQPDMSGPALRGEEKEKHRRDLLIRAWDHLRQSFVDAHLVGKCVVELEQVVDVPPEVWVWGSNDLLRHGREKVLLGLTTTGKPRLGKPFINETALREHLTAYHPNRPSPGFFAAAEGAITDEGAASEQTTPPQIARVTTDDIGPKQTFKKNETHEQKIERLAPGFAKLRALQDIWWRNPAVRPNYKAKRKYLMDRGISKDDAEFVLRNAKQAPSFRGEVGAPRKD